MQSRKRTFRKGRTKKCTCRFCACSFLAADIKASICDECKKPKPCLCGCGGMVTRPTSRFLAGHSSRVDLPSIVEGRKKQGKAITGKNNPSKKSHVRRKLSAQVKQHWDNLTPKERKVRLKNNSFKKNPNRGSRQDDGRRSHLESMVAEILQNHNLDFEYEPRYLFSDGRRFYPDFVVGDVLIEVTGFAYGDWRKALIKKIRKIQADEYKVICITYKEFASALRTSITAPVFTVKGFEKCISSPGRLSSIMGIEF